MCHKWSETFLVLNCANSRFLPFILQQETIILPLENNDIELWHVAKEKRDGYVVDDRRHLLKSLQAAKRASIKIMLKLREETINRYKNNKEPSQTYSAFS